MNGLHTYTEQDLLRLARRVNNPRRSYLLVNPLQGKHMPVDPDEALMMMRTLAKAVKKEYAGRPLVIGFSETATAIGAAIASEIGGDCFYTQTTREQDSEVGRWILFKEEHSHATEQKLCGDNLEDRIANCDYVLLVDDEISTGKTILNIVSAIRKACPSANRRKFAAASLINRVDQSSLAAFRKQGISFVSILRPEEADYEERVQAFSVHEADPPADPKEDRYQADVTLLETYIPAPHRGVAVKDYDRACRAAADEILRKTDTESMGDVLVLGTEEFMYPALLLARKIQESGAAKTVRFHATTRSPIGISSQENYPIKNGVRLCSMYAADRIAYLYDIAQYDTAIVFTDAPAIIPEAAIQLQKALKNDTDCRVRFFCGGQHV